MSASLLHRILTQIESKQQSPFTAQRALWRIARGQLVDDPKDVAHDLFDWFCEFSKTELSPEDQAVLETSTDGMSDADVVLLERRQRKVLKRARAAQRVQQSKVTPEVVRLLTKILSYEDCVAAADQLSFLCLCVPHCTPAQIIDLHGKIEATVVSFAPQAPFASLSPLLGGVTSLTTLQDPTEALQGVWWLAHTPPASGRQYLLREASLAAQGTDPGDKYNQAHQSFTTSIGCQPQVEYDVYNPTANIWERAANLIPVEYKPTIDYWRAVETLTRVHAGISARNIPEPYQNVFDLFEAYDTLVGRGDFETPTWGYIDETYNDVAVQTIISMDELQKNGSYMGNCTYSAHKEAYRSGTRVLFKLVYDGKTYNTDVSQSKNGFKVKETKGRHNSTAIPQAVKAANQWILLKLTEQAGKGN